METENTTSEKEIEPTTEKKKLLVVNPRLKDTHTYSLNFNSLHIAFVSDEEHKRTQCTGFLTCREYINRCVLSHHMNKRFFDSYGPGTDAPIDVNKLRLLLATTLTNDSKEHSDAFKQALFNAKAGINRYEELAGWKKSVICTVKHKMFKSNVWMITAPNEWMSQPQLLSLFVLLLRFITMHPTIDTTSIDTLHNSMIALVTQYNKDKTEKRGKLVTDCDLEYRFPNEDTILKYAFIVKNAEILFSGVGIEKAWPVDVSEPSFTSTSGIDRFIGNETGYSDTVKQLRLTFHDMWIKHKSVENKTKNEEV